MKAEDLKLVVKEKYGEIAGKSFLIHQSSCCATSSCCSEQDISMIGDEYTHLKGYNPDADLGLGCGIPTQFAAIKVGDSVLDLGSGAGNDCFVVRSIIGETGKVTGLDFTDAMIEKAIINLGKTGFQNIEFVQGDIEEMPLSDNNFDVVISNCVLNLVPDKNRAFAEIRRVLKSGGHFCVSDVVLSGELPVGLKESAIMYAGCVAGAVQKEEYLRIIEMQGFEKIQIHNEKLKTLPGQVLLKYLNEQELEDFKKSGRGIYSITVSGYKK